MTSLREWEDTIAQVQALNAAEKPKAAMTLLEGLLPALEAADPPVFSLLAQARGGLANALFKLGELGGARMFASAALEACTAAGDVDGVRIHAENVDLLKALTGPESLTELREQLAEAQDLTDAGRYSASYALLRQLATHEHIDRYVGKLCGLAGFNLYKVGDFDGARSLTASALESCTAAKDRHGMTIYAENLRVIELAARARP